MTINHGIKIKMSFAFIRTKIKLYTHTEDRTKGKRERGKKKDDNGFFRYFGAVEMSHGVCIWNWVRELFQT